MLTVGDVHLFDGVDGVLQLDDATRDLDTGIVAGAVIDGRLLARASCLARSSRHGDVGVGTLLEYRGRGLGTAAAGLVTDRLQRGGSHPGVEYGRDERGVPTRRDQPRVHGLIAKPVLDVDLTVPDVENEPAYVPRLEAVGFRLIFRDEIGGDAHRQLTFEIPNTNLHVWSPAAVEPQRHELFTRWLGANETDRERYATAKRAAVSADGLSSYNDLKSAVVYDIHERALLADLSQPSLSEHPLSPSSVQIAAVSDSVL